MYIFFKHVSISFWSKLLILTILNVCLFISQSHSQAVKSSKKTPTTNNTTQENSQKQVIQDTKIQTKKVDDFVSLGVFKDWEAFSMISAKESICWLSSHPSQRKKHVKNVSADKLQKSSLMISIRLEKKERDELAYHSKNMLDTETLPKITIDHHVNFKLIPQGQWAWLKSAIDESRFILAAQKGNRLKISLKTIHNQNIQETYSLFGFTDAYKAAFQACHKAYQKKSRISLENKN